MSGTKGVGLEHVVVDQTHAPVRDSRNPFEVNIENKRQTIWCTSGAKSTPIAVSLANRTTFFVQLRFTSACRGLNIGITGSVPSNPGVNLISPAITIGQDKDTMTSDSSFIQNIPVTIRGPSNVVPWGFSGEVAWELWGDSPGIEIDDRAPLKSTLSIYAVVDDLAPYFKKDGIPLQFLELMVLPTTAAKLTTRDAWVTWIVWRCFASKVDPDIKEKFPGKHAEAIHSYRYNAFLGGNANYALDQGATFDLDQWLVNCTPPEEGQWFGVNCYDQSALVQTALSLGVPHFYVDDDGEKVPDNSSPDKFLHTVGKLYRWPYGYIHTLDLIGWGESDSPFFLDAVQKMSTGLQKPFERESFRDHAWVYIRNSGEDPSEISALDAYAGPSADIVSVESYLATAVDAETTEKNRDKKNFKHFKRDKQPGQYNGVVKVVVDKPVSRWENHTLTGDSLSRLRCDGNELYIYNDGPGSNLGALLEKVPKSVTPIPVPVNLLLTNAFNKACDLLGITAPSVRTDIHVGDTATFPYGSLIVRTHEPAVSSDGTALRYDLWKKGTPGPPYLSIKVVVLENFVEAMKWLVTHICSINHVSDTVWDISSDEVKAGKVLISPKPGITFGATLQSNVLVLLEGTAEPKAMGDILSSVNDVMTPFFHKEVTKVDTSQCQLKDIPSNLNDIKTFHLKLKAPGAIDLSVESNTKGVHIQSTLPSNAESDTWLVNCATFSNPDYISSGRILTASFAAVDTWFTTTHKFSLDQGNKAKA